MTFLPIVERELREGARRKSTWRIRLVVAVVALAVALFQITFMRLFMGFGRTSGSGSFMVMTGYAFLLCLLAGVFVTADCLSEEKRQGTLGLLFLTDLKGYDVVLGKLAAHFLQLGYALVAIIPAAAIPLLIGGVTGGEVWRISLALLNLLFFALAAGILASALCREVSRAMMLTAGLLVFFCLVVPLLQMILNDVGNPSGGLWLGWLSPTQAYSRALESGFLRAPGRYWMALAGSHATAWALIALASWRLPRSWQDRPVKAAAPSPAFTDLTGNSFSNRTQRRRELLDRDPWLWLIGERRGVKFIMIVLTLILAIAVLFCSLVDLSLGMGALLMGGWMYLFVAKILFAAQACRFFVETRRAGAFEVLLATPITLDRLVSAQWTALRRTFGPPMIAAGGVCLLFFVWNVVDSFSKHDSFNQASDFIGITWIFGALGGLVEFLDFIAIGNLGMWLALTMRKPHLATGATLLFVVLLPLVGMSCAGFIGFILDIILIAVFGAKLRADFRQLVLDRPAVAQVGGA